VDCGADHSPAIYMFTRAAGPTRGPCDAAAAAAAAGGAAGCAIQRTQRACELPARSVAARRASCRRVRRMRAALQLRSAVAARTRDAVPPSFVVTLSGTRARAYVRSTTDVHAY
jgi:hypothetical protein